MEQYFHDETYTSIFIVVLCLTILSVAQNIFVKLRIKPQHLKAGDGMHSDKHDA